MITVRRLKRAIIARKDRFELRIINFIQSEKKLYCNACGQETVDFFIFEGRPFGCPMCKSSSRERFVLAAIAYRHVVLPSMPSRILHIAPSEFSLIQKFQENSTLIAADLIPKRYHNIPVISLDLTKLAERDDLGKFDLIYASHVLEHIPDDIAAIKAIYTNLNLGGQAWFMVPLHNGKTIEGTAKMGILEREERFGQWDHVRQYGIDITERFVSVGFTVEIISISNLDVEIAIKYGFDPTDKIFVCKK